MTDTLTPEERPSEIAGGEGHGLLTLPNGRSIPYKAHPLANLLPMMSEDELAALVEDVRHRGVQRPIVILDGMVLDGRNRYMAAREAEVGYRVVEFTGSDPRAFVKSENFFRRHLTASQKAIVAAGFAKYEHGGDRRSDQAADLPVENRPDTQAQAAADFGISERSVRAAKSVLDHGVPELAAAVTSGEVAVSAAAEVAKLPEAEQQGIVSQGPAAVKEAAKAARQPKQATTQEPKPQREPNGLSGLSREGLEDEVIGLRAENADLRKERDALKVERDDFKARWREATAEDQGKAIGNLQRQLVSSKAARDDAMAAAKRIEYRLKQAEKRVAELERTPIDMGA